VNVQISKVIGGEEHRAQLEAIKERQTFILSDTSNTDQVVMRNRLGELTGLFCHAVLLNDIL
jgi:hypothetical protein